MKTRAFQSLLIAAVLVAQWSRARADEGWKPMISKHGVSVSSRKVAFSPINEVRAEADLDLPAASIFAVLAEVESYPNRIPPTAVARLLRGGGRDAFYYMEIDPSMISRRYYCMRVVMSERPSGVLRSEWSTANDLCPAKQRGMVRIEDNAGAWTLTPIGTTRTHVVYQAHTDPGGAVPAWMVNTMSARTLPDLFIALERAVAREGGAGGARR